MVRADSNITLPATRAEAKKLGSKRYFTGMPCRNGHIAPRLTSCKVCVECNRINVRKQEKKRFAADPEAERKKKRERAKQIYEDDPEAGRAKRRKWRKSNTDRERAAARARRAADPDGARLAERNRRKANPEATKKKARKDYLRRREKPNSKLQDAIRAGIYAGLSRGAKAGRKTFEILGYTIDELRNHLERLFTPGMTWANYGKQDNGWEVDHIVPQSAFNYELPDDIDFRKCWSLENLRPLWGSENRAKGAKLYKSFQPSLALAIPAKSDNGQGVEKSLDASTQRL